MLAEFHEILDHQAVALDLSGHSRDEILAEMTAALAHLDPSLNQQTLTQSLIARENDAPTAMGQGIAIPHLRRRDIPKMLLAVGRSHEGVDYHARDGKPVHLFFMLLASDDASYFKILAKISRTCLRRELCQSLLHCKTPNDMLDLLKWDAP